MYAVTQKDINMLGSKIKQYKAKLEILNDKMQSIDIVNGDCLSCDYDCDSTGDVRRSCVIQMFVKNKKFVLNENSPFWINKFLKIYVGIQTNNSNGIVYYPLGLFVFTENDFTWNTTSRILEIHAVDFSWYFTQNKIGGAETTKILAGTNIRSALIYVVSQLGKISKYNISDIHSITDKSSNVVPYDIEVNSGSTVWELITTLRDLYVGYQSYFDLDTFVTQQIPVLLSDPIVLDENIFVNKNLVLNEQVKVDYSSVYNVVEIFGSSIEVDGYSDSSTYSNGNYSCNISSITALNDGMKIAVKLNTVNTVSPTLSINSLGAVPIVDADDTILSSGKINGYTAFQYKHGKFIVLGKYKVHSVCILRNSQPTDTEKKNDIAEYNTDSIVYRVIPDSPFSIEKIKVRKDVRSGSDYENIYANTLCEQRAQYENWKSTRLSRILTLETQLIPFLEVNQKIRYRLLSTGETKTFLITKISSSNITEGVETIEAEEFYPMYPDGINY